MSAEHCHDCPKCGGYFTCAEDDCSEDDFCGSCSQGNMIQQIAELETELVNEKTEKRILTAPCDDTWHCACVVPLQKRIAELEAELAKAMAMVRLVGRDQRIAELETQVVYEQERNSLNVAQHTDRIKELEKSELGFKELYSEMRLKELEAENKIKELEAELATESEEHEFIAKAHADQNAIIVKLTDDNARLREYLERLEWCKPGSSKFDGTTLNDCPACGAPESTYGHEYNCWLGKELKEGGK